MGHFGVPEWNALGEFLALRLYSLLFLDALDHSAESEHCLVERHRFLVVGFSLKSRLLDVFAARHVHQEQSAALLRAILQVSLLNS